MHALCQSCVREDYILYFIAKIKKAAEVESANVATSSEKKEVLLVLYECERMSSFIGTSTMYVCCC